MPGTEEFTQPPASKSISCPETGSVEYIQVPLMYSDLCTSNLACEPVTVERLLLFRGSVDLSYVFVHLKPVFYHTYFNNFHKISQK